jgi:hypothetical protein
MKMNRFCMNSGAVEKKPRSSYARTNEVPNPGLTYEHVLSPKCASCNRDSVTPI